MKATAQAARGAAPALGCGSGGVRVPRGAAAGEEGWAAVSTRASRQHALQLRSGTRACEYQGAAQALGVRFEACATPTPGRRDTCAGEGARVRIEDECQR